MVKTTENRSDDKLAHQLLVFHDDFNNMLGALEFYREAIIALIENANGEVLDTPRQRAGMARTGLNIVTEAQSLSKRLDNIRKSIG